MPTPRVLSAKPHASRARCVAGVEGVWEVVGEFLGTIHQTLPVGLVAQHLYYIHDHTTCMTTQARKMSFRPAGAREALVLENPEFVPYFNCGPFPIPDDPLQSML